MKRSRMSRGSNRRNFSKGNRVNRRNLQMKPMRGGWRI